MARLIIFAVEDEVCLDCWDWCTNTTGHVYSPRPVVFVEIVELRHLLTDGTPRERPNDVAITTPTGKFPVELMWVDTHFDGGTPG